MNAAPAAALNNVTVNVRVYRVAASPSFTRTQLGSTGSVNAGLVTTAGANWTLTITDVGEVILEAGETIQLSYYLNGTGQVGGLQIALWVGQDVGLLFNNLSLMLPAAIATRYLTTLTIASTVVATLIKLPKKLLTTSSTVVASLNRRLSLFRTLSTSTTGVASLIKTSMIRLAVSTTGVVSGLVRMSFDVLNRISGVGVSTDSTTPTALFHGLPRFVRPEDVAKAKTKKNELQPELPPEQPITFIDATPTVTTYTEDEVLALLMLLQ